MHRKRFLCFSAATLIGLLLLITTWAALNDAATATTRTANPGDVVINEVAWMGTAAAYNDEWIELYNTTNALITLTNWTLAADDGSPSITLNGVITAQGYFLLERTNDTTVNDIPADQIYTGALENNPNAETLRLLDESSTLIDTANLNGGEWPAGNNDTKHTMERIDPLAPDSDTNWASNDGITTNGNDADGNPLNGTPKARNSAYVGPPGNNDTKHTMERIDPLAPDSDTNWASNDGITTNGNDADGNPLNGTPKARNSAYVGPPQPKANLDVTKSGPITASPGSAITYTIRLSNTGDLTASAVHLTDSLPSAVTFITQTGAFTFTHDDNQLFWTIGELTTDTAPLLIIVTGQISATALGTIRNAITATTATTETITANNHAFCDTDLGGSGQIQVLVAALLYDGYQNNDHDEAIQLINVGDTLADLSGWKICDEVESGSCATIVSGSLGVNQSVWLASQATAFYTSSGFYPDYAISELTPGALALSGSWPGYANAGDQAVLQDDGGEVIDLLVYEGGDIPASGWSGTTVKPWDGGGVFAAAGQILYRMFDESTGLPVPDTNTAADWASHADDPACGRRLRYPGWDLETFYQPLSVTESASLTIGVSPDNSADVMLDAIESAHSQIEIGVCGLRHPTVIQKLVEKANAGVTVTILLEGDPTAMSKTDARWYQEMWACERLYDTGNGACWFMINDGDADIYDRYTYMHAKYMLIDRAQVLITSQNFTASSMPDDDHCNGTHGSRGIVLLTDAPSVVARVAQIFDHDLDPAHHADILAWSPSGSDYGPPPGDYSPVLSVTDYTTYTVIFSDPLTLAGTFDFELFTAPEAALRQSDTLLGLLAQAGAGDQVHVEQLDERAHWGDDPISDPSLRTQAYIAAARRGATVRILLNSGWFGAEYYNVSNNAAAVAYANEIARQEDLDLIATTGDPTQFGIHNKMVLVWLDGKGGYVHLGSLNGSETSNKINRELAIQVRSDEVYNYLKAVFDWDWNISTPLYLPLVMRNWSAPEPPVGYPVVSEALYNPIGAQESDEWIEIYNPTDQAIDLVGWYLGDAVSADEYGSGLYTFPAGATLPAGGIILIAAQAEDVTGFTPDFEFLIDPLRDDPAVPNMEPAGSWEGFGFALGNSGDEVILLDGSATVVDALVYGSGDYPGIVPHPGVSAAGHSLERRPALYDSDDCSQDFFDRYPPDPGNVSQS